MRKKMKNAAVAIMCFGLVTAVLTGCGGNRQTPQETQEDNVVSMTQENSKDTADEKADDGLETAVSEAAEAKEKGTTGMEESEDAAAESDAIEEMTESGEVYEDNFAVDNAAAKAFAQKVKDAAARKDLEALAELTAFPVYVGLPDVNVVETKEDFLKLGAETVFTEELLKSVEMADIENWQPSMAGFSICGSGNANINFGVVDGVLAINGINY